MRSPRVSLGSVGSVDSIALSGDTSTLSHLDFEEKVNEKEIRFKVQVNHLKARNVSKSDCYLTLQVKLSFIHSMTLCYMLTLFNIDRWASTDIQNYNFRK